MENNIYIKCIFLVFFLVIFCLFFHEQNVAPIVV